MARSENSGDKVGIHKEDKISIHKKVMHKIGMGTARAIDFPACAACSVSSFSVESNLYMMVHGCRSVVSYERDRVVLQLCEMKLSVMGQGLVLKSYFSESISISGIIDKIEIIK